MKNKKTLRTFALFTALLLAITLLGGCIVKPSAAPLLWKVTSPDGQTMHLFGSIHAAEEGLYPLPGYVNEAFLSSDSLAVEADIQAFEQDITAQMELAAKMQYPAGQTIADEVGAELAERAKGVASEIEEELGIPLSMLDMYRPAMWISALEGVVLQRSGLEAEYGLDTHFLTDAKRRGKEILEIESAPEQIDMLLGFSPPLQAHLLESALNLEEAETSLRLLYTLWKAGDELVLTNLFINEDDTEKVPDEVAAEYEDAMLTRRNVKMADAAKRYMSEGKNVFYVVGLAHMLGEGGIVDLLTNDGYTVEKVSAINKLTA